MAVKGRVRAVALLFLLLFLGPLVHLSRFQVFQARTLSERPDNVRGMEELSLRGNLLDRAGGVLARTRGRERVHPLGEAAGPLLGYRTNRLGAAGLEAALEDETAGRPIPRTPAEAFRLVASGNRRGDDVVLTLDRKLQEEAWRLLDGSRGAAVVLDVPTGEILALASRPSFDPARLDQDWERLRVDPDAPLIERGTQGLYPPGSTFKILIMAGALSEGRTRMDEEFTCTGSLDAGNFVLRDNAVHGRVDLERALEVSCNSAFGTLGMRLGAEGIQKWMGAFGLLAPLPLVPGAAEARPPQGQAPSVSAEAGIGQADLLVSPLAMARVTATLARGGVDLAPRLIRARTRGGKVTWRPEPPEPERVVSEEVAGLVRTAMRGVVDRGTGGASALPGVAVAGKTGTAENPAGRPHAWFVGYAPAEAPRVAVALILENAGGGGAYAAPLAGRLLQAALATP